MITEQISNFEICNRNNIDPQVLVEETFNISYIDDCGEYKNYIISNNLKKKIDSFKYKSNLTLIFKEDSGIAIPFVGFINNKVVIDVEEFLVGDCRDH